MIKLYNFDELKPEEILNRDIRAEKNVEDVVDGIIADVRARGDEALKEYALRFDGAKLESLQVTQEEIEEAFAGMDGYFLETLREAAANIEAFHRQQVHKNFVMNDRPGIVLGQKYTPIEKAGVYVPGGTAAYPSTVLMDVIPAKVAGVSEIVMTTPAGKDGKVNPVILAAAATAGVTKIFKTGGAQAVAALAFGTETIPKVEKITGPGNIFVTLAKKAVYGHVDIDMLAGPSEILIVADQTGNPKYLAADLLSQAEHDPLACAILITCDEPLARAVAREVDEQLEALPRKEIAETSLAQTGKIILAKDMDTVVQMANLSAPEHMEIMTENAFSLVPRIRNAGAIFLGAYSPEPLGDYYAGPNHILPTGGTARFYSVLNVETFMKKTSLISYTREALKEAADDIIAMAEAEGLKAHANAIRVRKGEL
jgi:histidinol dehydrogenase